MSRVEELRAQAQKLNEQADNTEDLEPRFELILEAMVLECEADSLEWEDVRPQRVVQQQQQPQPDEDEKK
jgi:hypothetical protein